MNVSLTFRALCAAAAFAAAIVYYQAVEPPALEKLEKWRLKADIRRPVEAGDILTKEMVEPVSLPVPASERSSYAWALDADEAVLNALIGRSFVRGVQPGALLEERFFFDDVVSELSGRIKPGHRAFAVAATGAGSVDNFIAPGSLVDVIGLIPDADGAQRAVVLLENVAIMAVGPISDRGAFTREEAGRHGSYTVQATPEQLARFLELRALAEGELTIILRSEGGAAAQ